METRCFGCQKQITGGEAVINALNKNWHQNCFRCCTCNTPLKAFFEHEGLIYCETDFDEKFMKKCTICKQVLSERYRTDDRGGSYHILCFCCQFCGSVLENKFFWKDDKIACKNCSASLVKSLVFRMKERCSKCRQFVEEGSSGVISISPHEKFHANCLHCSSCAQILSIETFRRSSEGIFFCLQCVKNGLVNSCSNCKEIIGIDTNDILFKNRHYHNGCFRCSRCKNKLQGSNGISINEHGDIQCLSCQN